MVKYLFRLRLDASFTIEAAVIVPITFTIIVWLFTTSFTIHNKVSRFAGTITEIIQNAPEGVSYTDNPYADRINTDYLDGRKVLLQYKAASDGIKMLTGGLEDED